MRLRLSKSTLAPRLEIMRGQDAPAIAGGTPALLSRDILLRYSVVLKVVYKICLVLAKG